MPVWLFRGGSQGEHEQKFIRDKRIYITWDGLNVDLSKLEQPSDLRAAMVQCYPDSKPGALRNYTSQVWPFAHGMDKGDLIILPLKNQRAFQIGEITGDYHFESAGPDPYYHWRSVKWIAESVPRANFSQDILYTLGAFMTICRVQRNNAEARIMAMRANGWKLEGAASITKRQHVNSDNGDESESEVNLEEVAQDRIAKLITARFKGHGLTRLVESILKAQGYSTYRMQEGPDGGVDILAGAGPLGFGQPRLCVEVKSSDAPIDRSSVDKLIGAVQKFGAQEGLFVSWSGFKNNVQKELAASYFRVRLWTSSDLLENLFMHYDKLDEDLKAELPLKRIWTVAAQEE